MNTLLVVCCLAIVAIFVAYNVKKSIDFFATYYCGHILILYSNLISKNWKNTKDYKV